MNAVDIEVTGGVWIVRPALSEIIPNHLVICRDDNEMHVIAIIPPIANGQPNWADASLMASSKEQLESLIEIYERVNGSKDTFHLDDINGPISRAIEKIHAEADV